MASSTILAILLSALAAAQQIGTTTPEAHLKLPTQKCTVKDGCKTFDTAVVFDAFSRSLHKVGDAGVSCSLGSPLCTDAESCAKNCALEGIDYAAHGVATKNDSLILHQYVGNADDGYKVASPRLYLVAPDGKNYEPLKLLNLEFSFDVDLSTLVCGMNGALYLSEMSPTGGRSSLNPAGAQYGTSVYPRSTWLWRLNFFALFPLVELRADVPSKWLLRRTVPQARLYRRCGKSIFYYLLYPAPGISSPYPRSDTLAQANINNTHGACCNEMDIWEANARSQAFTPHACNITGVYKCTGEDECGQPVGVCDEWGCSYNPYKNGVHDYYGPGMKVDTKRKFTVTTQFITDNGNANGTLTEIQRLYVQDGKVIQNQVTSAGGHNVSAITNGYCNSTATWFQKRGGLADMGQALERGMVLAFSIWNDNGGFMKWLDSGEAGPCNDTEGDPALIKENNPETSVTFSNIKWGEIGSTYKH